MPFMEKEHSRSDLGNRLAMDRESAACEPDSSYPGAAGNRTVETYEQIAGVYYEKWYDRSAILHHLHRFVEMMRAYRLAALPVVDIGCGPGFDAHHLRQAGLQVIGIDLSLAMMNAGRSEFGGHYVQADMRFPPVSSRMGGLWISASMLHLPRLEVPTVLERFAATLVSGGLLYLSLKAGQGSEWTDESHGQPLPRYFVYWQPEELDNKLREAGFQIVDGWVSPVSDSATWLIRFARKASTSHALPLNLA